MKKKIKMKIQNKWYDFLIKNINLSATKEIRRIFFQSKFVLLNQKKHSKKIIREIAFTLGPYLLCTAKNEIKINNITEEWINFHAEIPLGQIISDKNLKIKKNLIKKGHNYRTFNYSGDIDCIITETFYDINEIKIGTYCNKIFNTTQDEKNAFEFTKKNKCDLYLFPEAYPYSRRKINKKFPSGTIFGRYDTNGPEMYFSLKNKNIRIHKSTLFANEKSLTIKKTEPTIINYMNLNIALLVCYDLLNPKISYKISMNKIDLILISAMIPKKDLQKWLNFVYVRGIENQCPVILCSGKDKRNITNSLILYYNPIKKKVNVYQSPKILNINSGNRLLYSPNVHWSILLKNEIYGPFLEDY